MCKYAQSLDSKGVWGGTMSLSDQPKGCIIKGDEYHFNENNSSVNCSNDNKCITWSSIENKLKIIDNIETEALDRATKKILMIMLK